MLRTIYMRGFSRAAGRRAITSVSRQFSTTRSMLAAQILSGKKVAKQIREETQTKIKEFKEEYPDFRPSLNIIQVGARPDSSVYVRMKKKASETSGIDCKIIKLPAEIDESLLLNLVSKLNNDEAVNGILIQLPLPKHMDEARVTNSVLPEKDVDGFDRYNVGELAKRNGHPYFFPCTPNGCMRLLEETGLELDGKNAVVVGRSDIVGSPVAAMLQKANCTVTVCHSHTKNIQEIVSKADVLVVAIGQTEFVKGSWVKEGAVVIDVGMNYVPDSTKKSGHRAVGDVDYAGASKRASWITPVPGGVGPMTVAMLMGNVYRAASQQYRSGLSKALCRPLPLPLLASSTPTDIEISRAQQPKEITTVATELGVGPGELEPYGSYKAKVSLDVYERLKDRRENGNYVLVAGITPTPFGEGKSTTTMGLVQALSAHLGIPAVANVRQPSMGPTFGVKGGAAGGGYAQVIPMDEFNLHLTGDIHAIGAANNLLAAAVDTRAFHEASQSDSAFYRRLVPIKDGVREFTKSSLRRLKKLGIEKADPDSLTKEEIHRFAKLDIDPDTITVKRVVDVSDRMLREIVIGESATEKGFTRRTGFDITVASELMAILALSRDLKDMRERMGNIVVASSRKGEPITAEDIGVAGALTVLLKDAIKPNLMQTLEGTPVFVHAGPFANISIGTSSVVADRVALKLVGTPKANKEVKKGFVVTEAGFDFSMGGERFYNIKCRSSGLKPDVVVIVATIRALKLHGGAPDVKPGQSLPPEYLVENVEMVRKGAATNLAKQIANASSYGSPVVVAINKFTTDTSAEIDAIKEEAATAGAFDTAVSDHWAKGGAGALELANAVIRATEQVPVSDKPIELLYDIEGSLEDKLRAIATKMYGASDIELSDLARHQLEGYEKQGFGQLPVCIAKTQYSLSHDPKLKGEPKGFTLPIREIRLSAGAGYLCALAGKIMTIPGLPTYSGFMNVEVDDNGDIEGLF
ncbi:DEKNAAC104495 [Brettanomyces naardenensis]|uniref:DEKNAAC104495 n=1 Tax=Brettanomyces naardenensis TaxID=13370 RepID=A0A448YRC3_BRENA|nr:DEKNAAC104495 [Brettanomyces naardenensis]